jgi:16S rRNA (uracil1498-N3)-methyltransferase
VPKVLPLASSVSWLGQPPQASGSRWQVRGVLSLREAAAVGDWITSVAAGVIASQGQGPQDWCFFSGPEGGLTLEEEEFALNAGWQPVSLGRRVLRADTAPLSVLSVIAAQLER